MEDNNNSIIKTNMENIQVQLQEVEQDIKDYTKKIKAITDTETLNALWGNINEDDRKELYNSKKEFRELLEKQQPSMEKERASLKEQQDRLDKKLEGKFFIHNTAIYRKLNRI